MNRVDLSSKCRLYLHSKRKVSARRYYDLTIKKNVFSIETGFSFISILKRKWNFKTRNIHFYNLFQCMEWKGWNVGPVSMDTETISKQSYDFNICLWLFPQIWLMIRTKKFRILISCRYLLAAQISMIQNLLSTRILCHVTY